MTSSLAESLASLSSSHQLDRDALVRAYSGVRSATESLCEALETEDMVVQTMPDVSPIKWHLAHVTWFFEAMALSEAVPNYETCDEYVTSLFNSYYESIAEPYPRARRGLLTRPTVAEIMRYRQRVDARMLEFLQDAEDDVLERIAPTIEVGLHHEQQHQELMLMDILHVFAQNPLRPAYRKKTVSELAARSKLSWRRFDGGNVAIGAEAESFCYDNERPRHEVVLPAFELASRLVTSGEYLQFMRDGGYERPELWLADGWNLVQGEGWTAPLYWERDSEGDDSWNAMTLGGLRAVDENQPVCHVSYYEADAYARWADCRLPTEFEWEHATAGLEVRGNFAESGRFHPRATGLDTSDSVLQLYGDVWEWTSSPYAGYPGFQPFEGALGEYNGKFMINQVVLRGGCCVTPQSHIRPSYRNFYYPQQRWMFSGIRLARSA